jgi:diketogulonate reductase-like aldo/keto reductase
MSPRHGGERAGLNKTRTPPAVPSHIADEVNAIATDVGATPAQIAPAWLLSKGDNIAPIPGTKRVERVEENIAADAIELPTAQLAALDDLTLHTAGVSPVQASAQAVLAVDLYGTAVVLEEFGHVISTGGAAIVISAWRAT